MKIFLNPRTEVDGWWCPPSPTAVNKKILPLPKQAGEKSHFQQSGTILIPNFSWSWMFSANVQRHHRADVITGYVIKPCPRALLLEVTKAGLKHPHILLLPLLGRCESFPWSAPCFLWESSNPSLRQSNALMWARVELPLLEESHAVHLERFLCFALAVSARTEAGVNWSEHGVLRQQRGITDELSFLPEFPSWGTCAGASRSPHLLPLLPIIDASYSLLSGQAVLPGSSTFFSAAFWTAGLFSDDSHVVKVARSSLSLERELPAPGEGTWEEEAWWNRERKVGFSAM